MKNIIANSTLELEQIGDLLNKDIPSYRQAYSDRTAWIMACMSELAYIRFNPLFSGDEQKAYFIENLSKLVDKNRSTSLIKLLDVIGYDHNEEKKLLKKELSLLEMELVSTFDCNGTQAILVTFKNFIVLAFRGTEATSIKDIKADARGTAAACETGGKIHTGFKEAYDLVRFDIEKKLKEVAFQDKALFITGHSLGGALATVAAKKLLHKGGVSGCYTFGSPRVGDEEWIGSFKTPVYRLVNAADCVTMLPPGSEIITVISWLLRPIPWGGKSLRSILLSNFGGYLHCGDMRYLTNCSGGQYEKIKLLYAVSLFYRIKGLIIKKVPWKHFLSDHSISVYRKKLMVVAQSRNGEK